MRVKVNIKGKGEKVISLKDDIGIKQLVEKVNESFGQQTTLKSFRFGYPPRHINLDSETIVSQTLQDIGISSGEKISFELAEKVQTSQGSTGEARQLKENQISLADVWPGHIGQIHAVPDDNSCLFHALSYCVSHEIETSQQLREIVARELSQNKEEFSDAILGRPNDEYVKWILKNSSWGGGIEIAIISKISSIGIYVLDVDACEFEKFNEDQYERFMIVVFNGVHYDAFEVLDLLGRDSITVFDKTDPKILAMIKKLQRVTRVMKNSGYSFNTRRDRIKCNVCKSVMIGEREVARHAESTGHVDFGQDHAS
ncbi:LAMI_0G17392g1_1 [Lachancea mirantina]|uniref:Ubiquitin thioesterase OTU n=1 Tax=Lachancea mirantina TaxID=1230905 RepID=A0A1G4KCT0_9SACH|nr:LAMI_0G17392g1_1 [Lachancea mirantina]